MNRMVIKADKTEAARTTAKIRGEVVQLGEDAKVLAGKLAALDLRSFQDAL